VISGNFTGQGKAALDGPVPSAARVYDALPGDKDYCKVEEQTAAACSRLYPVTRAIRQPSAFTAITVRPRPAYRLACGRTLDQVAARFNEIAVTAPGADGEAEVCSADHGCLTWTRSYRGEAESVAAGPESCDRIAGPAGIAAAVVTAITRAVSGLLPGGQGRAA
jgi:hypothetical protein